MITIATTVTNSWPGRDSWLLNDDMYFRRVAGLIKTNFYGREFEGKPVLAFARRMDSALRNEKDVLRKPIHTSIHGSRYGVGMGHLVSIS